MHTDSSSQKDKDDDPTLSIVVQEQVESDSTHRVFLIYAHHGSSLTVSTSADKPYELNQETAEPALNEVDAIRSKSLGDQARTRFENAMQRITDVSDAGLEIWTPLRTSEAFAAGIWKEALGEKLAYTIFGRSSPRKLARSIHTANARDLGLSQDLEENIDLQLTPKERGLDTDQDQGQSL